MSTQFQHNLSKLTHQLSKIPTVTSSTALKNSLESKPEKVMISKGTQTQSAPDAVQKLKQSLKQRLQQKMGHSEVPFLGSLDWKLYIQLKCQLRPSNHITTTRAAAKTWTCGLEKTKGC